MTPTPVPAHAPQRERRAWPRWFPVLGVALVAAYPLYLLAVNVALMTNAIPAIVNSALSVEVEYESAHTWFPGHVTVNGLRLRLEDKNIQAHLVLPHADVRISLLDLTRRTFHATRVRGTGARFFFRTKIDRRDPANARRVGAFPAIPGFDAIPLSEAGPPPSESAEAIGVKKLWTVQLDDVESSVEELWLDEYRYQGSGNIKGGFRLEPLQRARIGPAWLELRAGTVSAGPDVVATQVTTRLDATVHPFEVQEQDGLGPIRFIEGKITLSAQLANLGALALYTSGGADPPIAGSTAQLKVEASFSRGAFSEGSAAHLDVTQLTFRKGPLRSDGPLSVSVRAPARGELTVGIDSAKTNVRVDGKDGGRLVAVMTGLTGRARFDAPDLVEGARLRDGKMSAAIDVRGLADLFAALGTTTVHAGHAAAVFEASADREKIVSTLRVDLNDLELAVGPRTRARADGSLQVAASGPRDLSSITFSDMRFESSRVSLRRDADGTSRATSLKLRVLQGQLVRSSASAAGAPCGGLVSELRAGNAAALAAFIDFGPARGVFATFSSGSGVYARSRTAFTGSRFEVDVEHMSIGDVEGRGLAVSSGGPVSAAFGFEAGGLTSGIDVSGGKTSFKPLASWESLDQRMAALRGPKIVCR